MSFFLKSTARRLLPTPLWTALRRWKGNREIQTFSAREVTHVYHGVRLNVALRDGLGEGWYDHDWPVQPEIAFLQRHSLRAGARVFDCGAHQAVVAMMLASIVGDEGQVVAVEALAFNLSIAHENLRLNPHLSKRVRLVRAAVTQRAGTVEFSEDFSRNGRIRTDVQIHAGKQVIPATTLDELGAVHGDPDVIFLDIEGAEQGALLGATRLLSNSNKPDWFIEVHIDTGLEILGGSASEICRILRDAGYKLFWCDMQDGHFQPLELVPKQRFYLCAIESCTDKVYPNTDR